MNRIASIFSALLIVALASVAFAQRPAAAPKINGPELFPLEAVRPGMKGTARTVFSGSDTQEFNVEILGVELDRKSTRLNSSHSQISYAVFCLKKKTLNLSNN